MRNLLAIIAATCGMACGAATAAEPARSGSPEGAVSGVPPRPVIPAPGRAVEGSPAARLVPASGSPIVLEAGKGTLIRLSRLRHSIHTLAPGQNVTVGSVDNALVLGGTV